MEHLNTKIIKVNLHPLCSLQQSSIIPYALFCVIYFISVNFWMIKGTSGY